MGFVLIMCTEEESYRERNAQKMTGWGWDLTMHDTVNITGELVGYGCVVQGWSLK